MPYAVPYPSLSSQCFSVLSVVVCVLCVCCVCVYVLWIQKYRQWHFHIWLQERNCPKSRPPPPPNTTQKSTCVTFSTSCSKPGEAENYCCGEKKKTFWLFWQPVSRKEILNLEIWQQGPSWYSHSPVNWFTDLRRALKMYEEKWKLAENMPSKNCWQFSSVAANLQNCRQPDWQWTFLHRQIHCGRAATVLKLGQHFCRMYFNLDVRISWQLRAMLIGLYTATALRRPACLGFTFFKFQQGGGKYFANFANGPASGHITLLRPAAGSTLGVQGGLSSMTLLTRSMIHPDCRMIISRWLEIWSIVFNF